MLVSGEMQSVSLPAELAFDVLDMWGEGDAWFPDRWHQLELTIGRDGTCDGRFEYHASPPPR